MKKIIFICLTWFININATTVDVNITKSECEKGNAEKCFEVGKFYHNRHNIAKKDIDKAFEFFNKSCNLGYIPVCTRLALTYENNRSMRYDINKSIELYQVACKGKDAKACERLGFIYEKGHEPFKANHKKSVDYFMKTCELDNSACSKIGYAYETGGKLKKDINVSIDFYTKACDKNNSQSCRSLAIINLDREKFKEAKKFLFKSCEGKDGWSCSQLGRFYEIGKNGFKKDINASFSFFDKACHLGSRSSCLSLGLNYFNGVNIKKDITKSILYLNEACNKAESKACKKLAYIYLNGDDGISIDKFKALKFSDRACNFGDNDSCGHKK